MCFSHFFNCLPHVPFSLFLLSHWPFCFLFYHFHSLATVTFEQNILFSLTWMLLFAVDIQQMHAYVLYCTCKVVIGYPFIGQHWYCKEVKCTWNITWVQPGGGAEADLTYMMWSYSDTKIKDSGHRLLIRNVKSIQIQYFYIFWSSGSNAFCICCDVQMLRWCQGFLRPGLVQRRSTVEMFLSKGNTTYPSEKAKVRVNQYENVLLI